MSQYSNGHRYVGRVKLRFAFESLLPRHDVSLSHLSKRKAIGQIDRRLQYLLGEVAVESPQVLEPKLRSWIWERNYPIEATRAAQDRRIQCGWFVCRSYNHHSILSANPVQAVEQLLQAEFGLGP